MKLVVGCPIRDRAWIIHRWFEHVHRALRKAGINHDEVTFVFIGDHSDDDTFAEIDRACEDLAFTAEVIDQPGTAEPYSREWGWGRYLEMAALRNELLTRVRELAPDMYWSLDSDILVSVHSLQYAIEGLERFDAVGSRCYMTPTGKWCPSYANLVGTGGLLRVDGSDLITVDVIMAAKLMSPAAYAVDYVAHKQGEDIGWSIAAKKAGCKLGWDGRTVSKHVMRREHLDVVDERCGF